MILKIKWTKNKVHFWNMRYKITILKYDEENLPQIGQQLLRFQQFPWIALADTFQPFVLKQVNEYNVTIKSIIY